MGYIHNIGFENFRIFDKMQKFEFAPITILTGPNNSGKSTLTKGLKLLAANAKENQLRKLDLSFNGSENWDAKKNWNTKSDETTVCLKSFDLFDENFEIYAVYDLMREKRIVIKNLDKIILTAEIHYDFEDEINGWICEHKTIINIEWINNFCNTVIEKFNNHQIKEQQKKEIDQLTKKIETTEDFLNAIGDYEPDHPSCFDDFKSLSTNYLKVFEKLSKLSSSALSKRLFEEDYLSIIIDSLFDLCCLKIDNEDNNDDDFPVIETNVIEYSKGSLVPTKYNELFRAEKLNDFGGRFGVISEKYGTILEFILQEFNKQYHISKKAFSRIAYESIQQNFNKRIIEKSIFTGHSKVLEELVDQHPELRKNNFIVKQIQKLGIADDIEIVKYDNFAYSINLIIDKKKVNVSELGYGFSQIVKMLVNLFSLMRNSVDLEYGGLYVSKPYLMIIEEPECNLHPNLQSKLADLFMEIAASYPVQFIIETHSEYLIRKLQYLIAKKELMAENVIIHYFNSEKDKKSEGEICKEIRINEDGVLTDSFGSGFFDEATRLKFDLLKLHKIQGN